MSHKLTIVNEKETGVKSDYMLNVNPGMCGIIENGPYSGHPFTALDNAIVVFRSESIKVVTSDVWAGIQYTPQSLTLTLS